MIFKTDILKKKQMEISDMKDRKEITGQLLI